MKKKRNLCRVLVRRSEGRPRRRREKNIRMDFVVIRCGVMDWILLAQDTDEWRAFVNTVMNLQIP
jgi:hypothetical protein